MVPFPTFPAGDKRLVLLKREEWGSVAPFEESEGLPLAHPIPAVLFTYTQTDMCYQPEECKHLLVNLREQYKEKGLYELPWNFVVGGDGTVFEARGWFRQPEPHIQYPEWAGTSLEIAHVGSKGVQPTQDQMIASWYIVNIGATKQPPYVYAIPVRRTLFYEFGRKNDTPDCETTEE